MVSAPDINRPFTIEIINDPATLKVNSVIFKNKLKYFLIHKNETERKCSVRVKGI